MIFPSRIGLAAAIAVCCVLPAAAQKTELPKHFNYEGEIYREYDKFEDKTKYVLRGVPVLETGDFALTLGAGSEVRGRAPDAPKAVAFLLTVTSKTPVRASDARLFVIVDGERLEFGELKQSPTTTFESYYIQVYGQLIARSAIDRIAKAKQVEMKFDGVEFQLSEQNRYAFRDFLHYVEGGR